MSAEETAKTFFTWDIHYSCNYHCTYCFLHFEPETSGIKAAYLPPEEWIRIWTDIYNKYGPSHISVTGGEPFTYPHFIDLIAKLSQMHSFEFSTNLSWDVEDFVKKVSSERVKINSSFHPEFIPTDDFLKKILYLEKNNYEVSVTVVAYPPFIEKIYGYEKFFRENGLRIIVYPYRGPYDNRTYPAGYTEQERVFLRKLGLDVGAGVSKELMEAYDHSQGSSLNQEANHGNHSTASPENANRADIKKMCRMGQRYAKITPNGAAYRCCAAVNKEWGSLGNIIQGNFSLLTDPILCPDWSNCRCYKAMIIGEETGWKKHWLDISALRRIAKESSLLREAKQLRDNGDIANAQAKVQEVVASNPQNKQARILLLELQLDQRSYAACEESLKKILQEQIDPENASWIYRLQGRLYTELGMQEQSPEQKLKLFEEASGYLQQAVDAAHKTNNLADRAWAYYEMGFLEFQREDFTKAKEYVNTALQYEPDNAHLLELLKFIEHPFSAVEKESSLLREAKQLRDNGDIANAQAKVQEVVASNPQNKQARILLLELQLDQRSYAACEESLKKILQDGFDSESASWGLRVAGKLHVELGMQEQSPEQKLKLFEEASGYLQQAVDAAHKTNNLADRAWAYYEMGFLEFQREDFTKARRSMNLALEYDPGNAFFTQWKENIKESFSRRQGPAKDSAKVTFGWDLCHNCNYKCPYCGVWKDKARGLLLTADEWIKVWDRLYERYGSCHIYMSGGEPSVYPYFYDLVRKLTKRHSVEICTNLSWEAEELTRHILPGRLKIAPTFHPSQANFEDFFNQAVKIKDYLPNSQIYYVAYSGEQIQEMPARSVLFKEHSILLIPYPLRGDQKVLNTEKEAEIIREVSPYKGEKIEYQLNKVTPKGKLCRAGHHYAVIRIDGSVDRCSQCQTGEIGNILDEGFHLMDNPSPCVKEYCPIESQWIVPGQ